MAGRTEYYTEIRLMDTFEARMSMRDLAVAALDIVERLAEGKPVELDTRSRLRQMLTEGRSLLADAGYPGDSTWRGIQRASMGLDTFLDQSDALFWDDVAEELRTGLQTLESLVGPGQRPDADIYVVG
jgi:hypothetical protein